MAALLVVLSQLGGGSASKVDVDELLGPALLGDVAGEVGIYLGFPIALVGTLFSAYLTYLEVFVIHALCQWCVASAAVMVAALICMALEVWRLMKKEQRRSAEDGS